jgi:hypothetical protein
MILYLPMSDIRCQVSCLKVRGIRGIVEPDSHVHYEVPGERCQPIRLRVDTLPSQSGAPTPGGGIPPLRPPPPPQLLLLRRNCSIEQMQLYYIGHNSLIPQIRYFNTFPPVVFPCISVLQISIQFC